MKKIFAALFALGTELLRRQTLGEFPGAELRPLSARLAQSLPSRHPGAEQPSGSAGVEADPLARIERLNKLRQEGALTEAEFEQEKRRVLPVG